MSWAVGFDSNWGSDVGYGVPSICDHPNCNEEIDRGLSYVCGGEMFGGENGCGLYFCQQHLEFSEPTNSNICEKCNNHEEPFEPTSDTQEWRDWKRTDESWADWRKENPEKVKEL